MAKKSMSNEPKLPSKGAKCPRPPSKELGDVKAAPKTKPSMQHKEPQAQYQYPKNGEQSMKLDHKKKALPQKDAPEGVKGVNEGESMPLPKVGEDRY